MVIVEVYITENVRKRTKKKLSSHDWVDVMKHDSNPTQTWTRTKIKANRAIDHLILLANKLPEEKQGEIFDETKVFRLIKSILFQNWENWKPTPDDFQADLEFETRPKFHGRNTNLAKTLVRIGTD
ncbi:MAG: hypothetical protein WA364_14820, partial [Candidatus Nitrosopolaris sp.]